MADERPRRPGRGIDLGRPGWTMLASIADGSGSFELFEERRDTPGGPPLHVHREHEELFYVLEGRYLFTRGDDEVELLPGEAVLIPRGTRHGFRTLVAPSRTLVLIVPSGLEGFFRGMGAELAAGRTPLEAMTALSDRFDAHPVD